MIETDINASMKYSFATTHSSSLCKLNYRRSNRIWIPNAQMSEINLLKD